MNIDEFVADRGITEILHFTRHQGLVGVLHTTFVKSRKRLNDDNELQYIFEPNSAFRKDVSWLDYVNMSITAINGNFFEASKRWHQNERYWWCILAFEPSILSHDGVVFVNTNNIYTSASRNLGVKGLAAQFESKVEQWADKVVVRPVDYPRNMPTCEQAEVLYPGQLSTQYLKTIYVMTYEDQDDVRGQFAALFHKEVPVIVSKDKFLGIRGMK